MLTACEAPASVPGQALLAGWVTRTAGYDRENRSFRRDVEELTQAGHLKMPLLKECGGLERRGDRNQIGARRTWRGPIAG